MLDKIKIYLIVGIVVFLFTLIWEEDLPYAAYIGFITILVAAFMDITIEYLDSHLGFAKTAFILILSSVLAVYILWG